MRGEYIKGEFDINGHLKNQGYSIEGLYNHLQEFIKPENVLYAFCNMAE